MTSFFGGIGNPFATPVGQRIEQATDASLASENWALNIEICDLINEMEDGPKDAIKAIRKRLQQNAGKNYTVVMYALTVLETCVKNCGRRFHVFACSKEFIQELVKLIGPKNDPPTAVQEKVLSLIQSWADAFRHQTELVGVVQVYQDLKQKGIEFPMTDLDTMAPIHTPQRSIPDGEVAGMVGPAPQLLSAPPSPAVVAPGSPAPPQAPAPMTSDQVGKLQSELDVVQGNMSVLSEMLSELTPGKEHPSDRELLDQLHGTCRAMQHRLVELIGKLANDQLTAELLRVNDELNNLFLRYTRFENNRESPTGQAGSTNQRPAVDVGGASLIDLSDEASAESAASVASKLSGLAISGVTASSQLGKISSVSAQKGSAVEKEDSEFDMFAQSRNVTYESSKTGGSTYEDNLPDQMSGALGAVAQTRSQPAPTTDDLMRMHKESDFDEMAAWLEEAPPGAATGVGGEESLTSSEFERFLAERAAAADALPSVPTTNPQPARSAHHHRPMNKESDAEASMFAL